MKTPRNHRGTGRILAAGFAAFRMALVASALALAACASTPTQTQSTDYRARAERKVDGRVTVAAAVLSPLESEQTFGLPLASKKVQPVWLEIDNQESHPLYVMILSLDANYFSPSEVAWQFKSRDRNGVDEQARRLLDMHIPVVILPHTMASGYVYTNLDPGAKAFVLELFSQSLYRSFEFLQTVPGFSADFHRVEFRSLYRDEQIRDLSLEALRSYLEELPGTVAGGDRSTPGDPLNLVIVGDAHRALSTLVSRGWDLTETIRSHSTWRTIQSSLFGSRYRTSPVSPLYLFGRPQDIALQKARGSVDERNHLRLWMAPVTYQGKNVWVGQISRDIGVRFSKKTLVTHKIDPMVDEARLYITLDLAASQSLRSIGFTKGASYSDRTAPRRNYTGDPYYTDGTRAVLFLDEGRYGLDEIELLSWEQPPSYTGECCDPRAADQ